MAFVLGITGGIATGKSTVLQMFARLGAQVLSADDLAKQVLAIGQPAYHEVVDRFGRAILRPNGDIDRTALAEIVFGDPDARTALNEITHPRVINLLEQRIAEFRAAHYLEPHVLAVEIPLLFECGLESSVDEVLVVAAEQGTQMNRLTSVGGLTKEQARARIRAQMPMGEKIKRSDRVIRNDGDERSLEAAVWRVWGEILLP